MIRQQQQRVAVGARVSECVSAWRGELTGRPCRRLRGLMQIAILNGVNLNMLGKRDPRGLRVDHVVAAGDADLRLGVRRGGDGALLADQQRGRLRRHDPRGATGGVDGLIVNPGAWTHYSYAIRDALEVFDRPKVEVHLSDDRAAGGVAPPLGDRRRGRPAHLGQGVDGYREAMALPHGARRVSYGDRLARAGERVEELGAGRAAAHRPRQHPLPDRLHRLERDARRRAGGARCS